MKISLEGLDSKAEQEEERINELEDKAIETTESKEQK